MNTEEQRIADLIRSAIEPLSRRTPPRVTPPERRRAGSSWTLRALSSASVVAIAAGAVAVVISRHSSTPNPAGQPAASPTPTAPTPSAGTDTYWFYAADVAGKTAVPVNWKSEQRGTPLSRPGPASSTGREFLVLPDGGASPSTIVDWSGHVIATFTDLNEDPRGPAMVLWSADDDRTLCAVTNPADVLGAPPAALAVIHPGQPTRVVAQLGRATNTLEILAGCSAKANVAVVFDLAIPPEGTTGGGYTRVRVLSLADGHAVVDRALPANTLLASATPDGHVLATTHGVQAVVSHGATEIYDATTISDLTTGRTLFAASGDVVARGFSGDDSRVVLEPPTGPNGPSSNPVIEVRDVSTGRTLVSLQGVSAYITSRAGDSALIVGVTSDAGSSTLLPARAFHEVGPDGRDTILFDVPAGG